jgi:hypothetical protein
LLVACYLVASSLAYSSTLKMEAVCSSETSVTLHNLLHCVFQTHNSKALSFSSSWDACNFHVTLTIQLAIFLFGIFLTQLNILKKNLSCSRWWRFILQSSGSDSCYKYSRGTYCLHLQGRRQKQHVPLECCYSSSRIYIGVITQKTYTVKPLFIVFVGGWKRNNGSGKTIDVGAIVEIGFAQGP